MIPHNTAAAPTSPTNTPAPNFTGVAAAFGDDAVRDSIIELPRVTEVLTPLSVCVPTDDTFTNGLDDMVGSEVVVSVEDTDSVDVMESDIDGVGVNVGVSVDVSDTWRTSKLAL
ncbi:hypothetical protein Daesc_006618 [Daldinia eschscholtzii]|uniref:Uncharacterized protein n=1 Tax=Daldinia eschscholtzii TaxID=292717 RepID=A0AAX6MHI6_9PEZI